MRERVSELSGSFDIRSGLEGTRITVTLPIPLEAPVDALRIVLADDHEVVRRGVRSLVESHPGWEICGEATNGREAVELVARLNPDLSIVDMTMPELNGLETTQAIRASDPDADVIILTMHDSPDLWRQLREAGARDVILKSDAHDHLIAAIDAVRTRSSGV
jgi:DNA-binding NarL/FixJ family response regulator